MAVAKPGRARTPETRRPPLRVIAIEDKHRPRAFAPRPMQMVDARARGETSAGAGLSLTLAFLIAGGIVVAALTFWSGPEVDRGGISVQPPDSAVPVP